MYVPAPYLTVEPAEFSSSPAPRATLLCLHLIIVASVTDVASFFANKDGSGINFFLLNIEKKRLDAIQGFWVTPR